MTDRKKPGVAFWATVVMVVFVIGYPLSFGAAVWLDGHDWLADWSMRPLTVLFWPIFWLHSDGPESVRDAIDWYAHLCNDGLI